MDLISVIVPVYKVEAYLDRCVQSIVDQTYRNLEIILVDDGSPDNCPSMCDAWAEKDSRIKVIHKSNGGGAQARNMGLDCATGQYITFVDSDDFIHSEMYSHLYEVLMCTNSDIAECGYFMVVDDKFPENKDSGEISVLDTETALRENINDRICRQLLWNKLYRRATIGSIRMTEGKTIDDEFFTYKVLARADKVSVSSKKLYAYRQQCDSIMHQRYSTKWLGAVEARWERLQYIYRCFPSLLPIASNNLLFTCLYHGQLVDKFIEKSEKKRVMEMLSGTYHNVKPCYKILPLAHRCWLALGKVNFILTCRIRNFLRVGL